MLLGDDTSLLRVKGDLHIHSIFSDGKPSPLEVILVALRKKLRVISITDHNSFKGSSEALRIAKNMDLQDNYLVVIPGAEIRTSIGEIILYCHEPLENFPTDPYELLDYSAQHQCFTVAPHPYDLPRLGIGTNVLKLPINGVEVFNASAPRVSNMRAMKKIGVLADKTLFANSDAHIPEYIGVAFNILFLEELSLEAVFTALRKKRVIPVPGSPQFIDIIKRYSWSIARRANPVYQRY